MTAWGQSAGTGDPPGSVTGIGDSQMAALRDLDQRLRCVGRPSRSRLEEFRHQLRMAYVDGAEAFSRETLERGLTSSSVTRGVEPLLTYVQSNVLRTGPGP